MDRSGDTSTSCVSLGETSSPVLSVSFLHLAVYFLQPEGLHNMDAY
jgi:hypothetical protein